MSLSDFGPQRLRHNSSSAVTGWTGWFQQRTDGLTLARWRSVSSAPPPSWAISASIASPIAWQCQECFVNVNVEKPSISAVCSKSA